MDDVVVVGLNEIVADLTKAASRAPGEVVKVLAKGALNIKTDARRRVTGLAHAPAYPAAIGYDVYHLLGSARARIGPDKAARQGALGNILEFGTVKNAPIPHLSPALSVEEPRFVGALEDLAVRLLEGS